MVFFPRASPARRNSRRSHSRRSTGQTLYVSRSCAGSFPRAAAEVAGAPAAVAAFAGADRLYCASLLSAVATAQAIGEDTPTYVVSGRSAERAAFDDGDDDLAVAEHIEALRLGRTPPADTSHRIITSPAAARLREIGVAEADIRCAATPVHGPTLVAARDDRGLRLTPVLPTWQPAAGAR